MLILSLVLFLAGQDAAGRRRPYIHIGGSGLSGPFITGIFFVSTFAGAGQRVLFRLAESLHPIEVALLAGLGPCWAITLSTNL